MIRQSKFVAVLLMTVIVGACMGGVALAQQPYYQDIWHYVPSDSLMVAAYDGRPTNASIVALTNAEDPESQEQRIKQEAALRKAAVSFATLFGVSLDFATDIDSWQGKQWAFVLLNDGKEPAPVFMIASDDQAAANAALDKLTAPFDRVGELTQVPDAGYNIIVFKTRGVAVYGASYGPVVAFSTSKAALKQSLQGQGFATGSTGEKAVNALSGSLFYAYADPKLIKEMHVGGDIEIPVDGFGLGLSVVNTGVKLNMLGFINEMAAATINQMVPTSKESLVVNNAIPSVSLVDVALPNLSSFTALAGFAGQFKPVINMIQPISDTQISAAITAALPMPAGVVTAKASSEQDAADKLAKTIASLKKMKVKMRPGTSVNGIANTLVHVSDRRVLLAQVGSYIVVASDAQSLSSVANTINDNTPSMITSDTYKPAAMADTKAYQETMEGLGNCNLLTAYVNLAPVQGLGYLIDGSGFNIEPIYGELAKSLENLQALGIGAGLNGDVTNVTLFLRAKPEVSPGVSTTAALVGASIVFPLIAQIQMQQEMNDCAGAMMNLAMSSVMYSNDNNGKLPTRTKWRAQLEDYYSMGTECSETGNIYAYNKNLSGLNFKKILNPSEVVVFFEACPDLPNASGSRADAVLAHDGGWFAYLDGHVKFMEEVPSQSHWVPKYKKPAPVKKTMTKKTVKHKK